MTELVPTPESFFAARSLEQVEDGKVPRDYLDRPCIIPLAGEEHLAIKSSRSPNRGLIPYDRSSSFGSVLEDDRNLVLWQKRQVARGVALLYERAKLAPGPAGGLQRNPLIEPDDRDGKDYWNSIADRAESEVGSYDKAELGTAIHAATEQIDGGGSLQGWPEHLVERANAYWSFIKQVGFRPTSIEVFGVEDVHHVAGTWDRTGWWGGKHKIGDVKTSGTMDFAGIGFAVQLAEYAHMAQYDPTTGERTPHEEAFGVPMDLEEALIIHVGREMYSPVELYRVDIATGWRFAQLVDQVKKARTAGKKTIVEMKEDPIMHAIHRTDSMDELRDVFDRFGSMPIFQDWHRDAMRAMATWFRSRLPSA